MRKMEAITMFDANCLAKSNNGENTFFNCGPSIGGMTVTIAGSSLTTIAERAFNCAKLKTITLPASVTSVGDMTFTATPKLETVTFNSNPYIGDNVFPSGVVVTMNLTAHEGKTNEYWTTFYNMNYSFEADEKTQVFKVTLSGDNLTMHEVEDKIVNGGTAVVLKTTGGNPVMTKTTSATSNVDGNDLSGVSVPEGMLSDGYMYVLNKGSQGVGFYKLTSGKTIGVGKASLYYNGTLTRECFGFSETSGIESVSVNDDENGEVYDLQGRRVSQPAKGLYIVNGKKYI